MSGELVFDTKENQWHFFLRNTKEICKKRRDATNVEMDSRCTLMCLYTYVHMYPCIY